MSQRVDFTNVSAQGLESSAVSHALAGLRANEARYFHTKYGHEFTVSEAADDPDTVAWVAGILEDERGIVIASRPLQVAVCDVDKDADDKS